MMVSLKVDQQQMRVRLKANWKAPGFVQALINNIYVVHSVCDSGRILSANSIYYLRTYSYLSNIDSIAF